MRERLALLKREREDDAALELQEAFAAKIASAALLEMNDIGGSRLAICVASRGAELCAKTTRFSCEYCGQAVARVASGLLICSGTWHP